VQSIFKLTAYCSLLIAMIAGCGTAPTPTATLVASLTPSPIPTLQNTPMDEPTFVQNLVLVTATTDPLLTPTAGPTVISIAPITSEGIAPPFSISLPPEWEAYYTNYLLPDVGGLLALPLAMYRGPVSGGGTGWIAVLWAFPNLSGSVNMFQPEVGEVDLFADGLRLLRLAVLEQGCNIGTDLQRQYTVGGMPATGTQFSAVTCPENADTRGWMAGLPVNGLNFLFYVYTDPITAIDDSRAGLQAILDSVRFVSAAEMQATAMSMPTTQPTFLPLTPEQPLMLETNTPQP
jgi:hypothetical protein